MTANIVNFIPLPSDPCLPMSAEQLIALRKALNWRQFERGIAELVQQHSIASQPILQAVVNGR